MDQETQKTGQKPLHKTGRKQIHPLVDDVTLKRLQADGKTLCVALDISWQANQGRVTHSLIGAYIQGRNAERANPSPALKGADE